MALDPGARRIGVAISDELGVLARPLAVIERRSRAADLGLLAGLVDEHKPGLLLVGLPVLPSGDIGPQGAVSQRFAELLRGHFRLPVELWNESYSTIEARRRRQERPRRRRSPAAVDAEAAAVFLQQYLDART